MTNIYNDLYQFTETLQPIGLGLHQYLLLTDEPVLVSTGTLHNAKTIISNLKEILGSKALKYVLVSHFESDECGCLSQIIREYPEVNVICSDLSAREMMGFGITFRPIIKKDGDILVGKDFEIKFIDYPSEIHNQNGLVFMEMKRNIFFSTDLMFEFNSTHGQVRESKWEEELKAIEDNSLVDSLSKLNPKFIAVGHGTCLSL